MNEVNEIAIDVIKEDEAVALIFVRLGNKRNSLLSQLRIARVEVFHQDGDMAHAGRAHFGWWALAI